MKYNWWLAVASILIFGILGYVFSYGEKSFGVGVVPVIFCGNGLNNAISTWDMEQKLSEAQEKRQQTESPEQYVAEIVSGMSLEQKLAQMMILSSEKDITENGIKAYQPGGIILFSSNFDGQSAEQVRERIKVFQADIPIPLFVGVDEEGGNVSRVAGLQDEGVPVFQSARQLYEAGGIQAVYEDTVAKTKFLASMGINLNFAPVADVVEQRSSYMYDRSASGNPEEVADYVETVVNAMEQENMGCCLKHFPGYGENVNTHRVYAVDQRDISSYRSKDFIPFSRGIAAGADMIMVSHIVMEAVDETKPASLSPEVHTLLREELGFEGVIMADDLNMRAILSQMTLEDAAAEALIAGNDMIFSADFMLTMQKAKKAVEAGKLSEQQIDDSVTRILKMKIDQGLIVIPERE